jgi:hypothetical protein
MYQEYLEVRDNLESSGLHWEDNIFRDGFVVWTQFLWFMIEAGGGFPLTG